MKKLLLKKPSLLFIIILVACGVLGFLLIPLAIVLPSSLSAGSILSFSIKKLTLSHYAALLLDAQWRGPLI